MKPWRLRIDRDGRERPAADRARKRTRPGVECLEGRALLATITPVPTNNPQRNPHQPAAYRPPTQEEQKYPPFHINPVILSPTDGGGANSVFQGNVEVGGLTFPYSTVWLAQGIRPGYFTNVAQADVTGHFAFIVPVGRGSTLLRLFSENSTDDYSYIDTVTVNRGNPIEAWDSLALHAIQVASVPAPEAARDLAVLHAAQYDAVANVDDPGAAYQVHDPAPKKTSAEAAANSAAYTVLTSLFPAQAPLFASAEQAAITGLPQTSATVASLNFGDQVANQTLADRANDGSNMTGATITTDVSAQFAKVKPFEIAGGSAFRPAAPAGVGSATYDQALSQVASLGGVDSTARTSDESAAALYWNGGTVVESVTDPAHWNAIADQVSIGRRDSLLTDARLFAELDFALADAGIAASDSQTTYQEARPFAAAHQVDPSFYSFLATPSSPSYVSDHAAYASAASKVLTSAFGSKTGFTDQSQVTPRSYNSFAAAASEDASSRIWGGVNFSTDTQAGADLGAKVGQAVLDGFPKGK